MSDQIQMECPECGKDAVPRPAEQVARRAHRMPHPEWSHRDGSSLCPVIGPSGAYEPARPQRRYVSCDVHATQPGRPATMSSAPRPGVAGLLAGQHDGWGRPADLRPPSRKADTVGTRYMRCLIAGLGDMSRPAEADCEYQEPEAGA